ncbi:hypothetical protein MD484_g5494, partial [Candolleomyces efflorescens]
MTSLPPSSAPPSPPGHIQVTTALIRDHKARVAQIDKEIQALVDRRNAYMDIINQHAPSIAPIRRLSPDVLALIFRACVESESTVLSPPVLSRTHPAVVASHVCAEWRKLVLGSPTLWTDLVVKVPKRPRPMTSFARVGARGRTVPPEVRDVYMEDMAEWEERMHRLKEMVQVWIGRSASCAVNVAFNCTDTRGDRERGEGTEEEQEGGRSSTTLVLDIVALLTDVSSRWRSANFSITVRHRDSPLRKLLTLPVEQVPNLEKFHLELGLSWGSDMDVIDLVDSDEDIPLTRSKDVIPSVTLFHAPSLRSLKVDNGQRHWANASVPSNWASLTELCLGRLDDHSGDTDTEASDEDAVGSGISNFTVDRVIILLKACPNLVRFGINVNHGVPRVFPLPLPSPISLPSLECMELRGVCLPLGFAASLDLPSLRRISIIWPFGQTKNTEESELVDLLKHFGNGLVDVTMDYACLSQDALTTSLQLIPNVECLRVVNSGRSYFRQVYYNHGLTDEPEEVVQAQLGNAVMQRLTPKWEGERIVVGGGEEELLCPKLRKFGARISMLEFQPQALVEFIAARRNSSLTKFPHLHSSASSPSRLDTVIVAFKTPKRNFDVRKALEDQNVDLEDFELKTSYREVPNELLVRWKDHSWYDPDSVLQDVPGYANVF